jgi:hypothetical protein
MSRAYRIRVRESLVRGLHAEDKITTTVELLDVLPEDQMGALLEAALKERGFEEQDGKLVRTRDGVTVTVDVKSRELTVQAEADREVELTGQREGLSYDDAGPGGRAVRDNLRKDLLADLEKKADHEAAKLQTAATERLETALCELQPEIDEVVHHVTAEALKEKARSMGEIKEISEDPQSGSLTITLEV